MASTALLARLRPALKFTSDVCGSTGRLEGKSDRWPVADGPITVTLTSAGYYNLSHEFRSGQPTKNKTF